MLDSIPEQYHIMVGIGALVLLLLVVSSAAQKYQSHQLRKEAALRHMVNGIRRIETALENLQGAAVPTDLLALLRKEILARYMAVKQIYSRYDNIASHLGDAQRKLQAAESAATPPRMDVFEKPVLDRYVIGLTELISFLNSEGHIAGMNAGQRKNYQTILGNLRADYVYQFYTHNIRQLSQQQAWTDAMSAVKYALNFLQSHGPVNDHVTNYCTEINQLYKQVANRQMEDLAQQQASAFDDETPGENPTEN